MGTTNIKISKMNEIGNDDVVEAYISGSEDYVIPLVFPNYLIRLEGGSGTSGRDYFGTDRVPLLGHAGVLIINGQNGKTKYYEYGRYPPGELGRTRSVQTKDVIISSSKMINIDSFKKTLRQISNNSGQKGNIKGAILRKENVFNEAIKYCEIKIKENNNPDREPYSIYTNNCVTFVEKLVSYLDFPTPSTMPYSLLNLGTHIYDKIPTAYIIQFQAFFPARDLFYYYKLDKLEVNY
ncbi:hypothetical protein A9G34_03720 [Gilliamella sp. Choc4-2]|uniref:hypothetical protein n=1 Tax=Gilliamella sp. Choc4-2 TaxID=3120237 RepID=UPI00080EE715|nr:hypothetical protein [Gilliamella apicola]OCG46981.1 hypothetical protein A9G34_03720 [Gilliamella apicola]